MDCHLYTGDCNCNPQIVGKYCDTRGCNWGIWEYDSCVLTDLTRCAGRKNRTRKEYITKGGDFSTIIKVNYLSCFQLYSTFPLVCLMKRKALVPIGPYWSLYLGGQNNCHNFDQCFPLTNHTTGKILL